MATTTKKATKKSTSSSARKSTAKKTATTRKTAPKRTPLATREPKVLAGDASYAAAGLAVDAVTIVRQATAKLEQLREEVRKAASDPSTTVRTVSEVAPATVTRTADDVRGRLIAELETAITSFERTFDAKATEGRKLVTALREDARVRKLLDQTSNTRSQLKAALTSVTRTVDVAVDAGRKQAGNATSQVKAATTSLRRSAATVPDASEAVETEVEKAS